MQIFAVILVILSGTVFALEYQRLDGYYNNLQHLEWGGIGQPLIYLASSAYDDGINAPAIKNRPPAGLVSWSVFRNRHSSQTYRNLTAFHALFGQVVTGEIVSTMSSGKVACPVERLLVHVGNFSCSNLTEKECVQEGHIHSMSLYRVAYAKTSGLHVNNPRKPISYVTPWIDGNFVYSTSEPWLNALRTFHDGSLKVQQDNLLLPEKNGAMDLPLLNPSPSAAHPNVLNPSRLFAVGSFKSNQSPPLLAFSIILHRWHNVLSQKIATRHQNERLSEFERFETAKRWLIATLQNVIAYEYLPVLINDTLPPYSGYKPHVDPSISVEFQSAAFRIGHSALSSVFFVRDADCKYFRAIPFCKYWWDGSSAIEMYKVDRILRGIISQKAEAIDHVFSDIITDKMFGSQSLTFRDLVAINIMRGRDEGVADYNAVRKSLGLNPVHKWTEINPDLALKEPELFDGLRDLYNNSLDTLDLYVGGVLESTPSGIGDTFKRIIVDQFTRIRDSDRFWFENPQNGLFSDADIAEIKKITIRDIVLATTNISAREMQHNLFLYDDMICMNKEPKSDLMMSSDVCGQAQSHDFFDGSHFTYIFSWIVLLSIPFVCMLIGWLIYLQKERKVVRLRRLSLTRKTMRLTDTFMAFEQFTRSSTRRVQIRFGPGFFVQVLSRGAQRLKTFDLNPITSVLTVKMSYDTGKDCIILLHFPKEYDLILVFATIDERTQFYRSFNNFLNKINKLSQELYGSTKDIMDSAVTYEDRAILLQNFFQTAFDQVFNAKDSQASGSTAIKRSDVLSPRPDFPLSAHRSKKRVLSQRRLMSVEITKAEFANALQLKPESLFVSQMFIIADKDRNGYLSYPEFLDLLALLWRGDSTSRTRMLFEMYDLDGSGDLNKHEFFVMIRSLTDLANRKWSDDEVKSLAEQMLAGCGLEQKEKLSLSDFQCLIQQHHNVLLDSLDVRMSTKKPDSRFASFSQSQKSKNCSDEKIDGSNNESVGGQANAFASSALKACGHDVTMRCMCPAADGAAPIAQFQYERPPSLVHAWRVAIYMLENRWAEVICVLVFLFAIVLLFLYYALIYTFFKEHTGIRQIVGYAAAVSRGAAAALSLTYCILLLTACRNLLTWLRETWLQHFVPMDSAIEFHRLVAYISLLLSLIHIVGHAINFYQLCTQPSEVIACAFPEIASSLGPALKFHHWAFMTVPGLTGILLVILLSVMFVFASRLARQHIFAAFWATHRLFPLVYALIIIHGSGNVLQGSFFYLFLVGPATLYVFDWIYGLRTQSLSLTIVKADVLPSDVLHLSFRLPAGSFRYSSGQWVRLCCPLVSNQERHPFTITSAPHQRTLDVYIRAVGPWTRRMLDVFTQAQAQTQPFPKILIEGPYGSSHQDWYKFEVVVLVGAGIGVTPHASVLQDLTQKVYQSMTSHVWLTRRVYFVWLARSHQQFEWFTDILSEVEQQDVSTVIQTDIFITRLLRDWDVRTTMLYIAEHHFQRLSSRSLFTGLRANTHFGRPDFYQYLLRVHLAHQNVSKIGIFTCGPKSVVRSVKQACGQINQQKGRGPVLIAHYEHF